MPKFNVHVLIPTHTVRGVEADSEEEAIDKVWNDQILTVYRKYSDVPYRVIAEEVGEDEDEEGEYEG